MRAVTIADNCLKIAEKTDPQPGVGEVLVRVRAAGLNGADVMQLAGRYPAPPGSPVDIPGLELAGEVASLGPGATRFQIGDRVMAIVGGGGQAELCIVHERILMPVPERLTWAEAGGAPEAFTTAHDALFTQCQLVAGEHVLVHGGAGGVGMAAIQLARHAGARVTTTVRNPELRERVAELGASVIPPEGFGGHGPFDVILELVGSVNFVENLASMQTGGRISVIGTAAGSDADLNLNLLRAKRAKIFGSTLRARPLEEKAMTARAMERSVLPALAAGDLQVPLSETFAMDEAKLAYDRFTSGGKFGKIVLLG